MDQLTIHLPGSDYHFETDNYNVLSNLSDFCKANFNAYRAIDNLEELTISGNWSQEMEEVFLQKTYELGLISH